MKLPSRLFIYRHLIVLNVLLKCRFLESRQAKLFFKKGQEPVEPGDASRICFGHSKVIQHI